MLFHEIAHLLLHISGENEVFAEYEDQKKNPHETEADRWARNKLVYGDRLVTFMAHFPKLGNGDVKAFAQRIKIHPAIVAEVYKQEAGREVIPYKRLQMGKLYPNISKEDADLLWTMDFSRV